MIRFFLPFILLPVAGLTQSWSYQQCIDSAIKNNIDIQKCLVERQIGDINLKSSKNAILPSVNSNLAHGYNWGQTIDPFTNQFATNRIQYDNFNLSSGVILFSGLQNHYNIKINEINTETNAINYVIKERNIKIDVSAGFLQVLLNKEMVLIAESNLLRSQNLLIRLTELVKLKEATSAELLELNAQIELEKYTLIKCQSDLKNAKLQLQNLLNLPYSENFEVIDTLMIDNSELTGTNSSLQPEIDRLNLSIQKQYYQLKSAKGKYLPTLSVNGTLGSGYSGNNKTLLANGQYVPKPFNDQIRSNFYQSAYMSLSIPIFNRGLNRNQITIEELELKSLNMDKQNEENLQRQKLNELSLEIFNLKTQISALESVKKSAEANYYNYEILYKNGNATGFQLVEAKNKLTSAESQLMQAQYQLIFKEIIQNLYH